VDRSRLERAGRRHRRRLVVLATLAVSLAGLSFPPGALALGSLPSVQVSVPVTGTTVKVDPGATVGAVAPSPSSPAASAPKSPAPASPAPAPAPSAAPSAAPSNPAPAPAQPASSPAPPKPSAVPNLLNGATKQVSVPLPAPEAPPKVVVPTPQLPAVPAPQLPAVPAKPAPSGPSTGLLDPVTGTVNKVVSKTVGSVPPIGTGGPGGGAPPGSGTGGLTGGGGPTAPITGTVNQLIQKATSVLNPIVPLGSGGGGPLNPGGLLGPVTGPGGLLGPVTGSGGLLSPITGPSGLLNPIVGPGGLLGPVTGPGGLLTPITGPGGLLTPITGPGGLLSPITGPGGLLTPITGPGGLLSPITGPGGLLTPIVGPGGLLPIGDPGPQLGPVLAPLPVSHGANLVPALSHEVASPINSLFPVSSGGGGPSNPAGTGQVGGPSESYAPPILSDGGGPRLLAQAGRGTTSAALPQDARGPPMAWPLWTQTTGTSLVEPSGSGSPVPPSTPWPRAPGGALSVAAGSSTSLFLAGFAALLALAAWALPRLARRPDAASALWRPMPFVSLLERPG
jgi:hypothetical protein